MIKKIVITIFLLGSLNLTFAQINTALIKKNVIEDPEKNFYQLLEIFKSKPQVLTQEELNQLYYGSKFLITDYSIVDYNRESDTFWKVAHSKISRRKAEKIKDEAEIKYLKNPLNKSLLDNMIAIYSVLNETHKADLCRLQKQLIYQTVENSGDGKTEETAICVLTPRDVFSYLDLLISSGPKDKFEQKMKQLEDGSILHIYKIGERKIIVKLVGGFQF